MKKYTLKRLESLGLAFALTATLSSCCKNKDNLNTFNARPIFSSSFGTVFNTSGEMATKELNKRIDETKKQSIEDEITEEDIIDAFNESKFYSDDTKAFIKSYLKYWTLGSDTERTLIDATKGNKAILARIINDGRYPFPFGVGIMSSIFDEFTYNRDLQLFDNRKGVIPTLPHSYLQLVKANAYDDFNVYIAYNLLNDYESRFCIITDSENRIIAHTNEDYVELDGKKFQLTNFNWKLKKLGLEYKAKKDYSMADLMDIQASMNAVISGYKLGTNVKTSNIIVFDTRNCVEDYTIRDRQPYYFLEFLGEDIFTPGAYFYRDLMNPNVIAYFDANKEYFAYRDFTKEYDQYYYDHFGKYLYFMKFSMDSSSFAPGEVYFKSLNDFLQEHNLGEVSRDDYLTCKDIEIFNSQVLEEEPHR